MPKPVRIGLLWHSMCSGNLGVGALTIANIAIIREAARLHGAEPTFIVMGMRDKGAPYVHDSSVDFLGMDLRTLMSPRGYWAALKTLDAVIDIGAGDSFTEIYGVRRFVFLWLSKILANIRSVPLVLAPQTIGPFTKFPYVQLAAMALRGARAVVARDSKSLDLSKRLAPKTPSRVSLDVAFALPFSRPIRAANSPARIGINVSGLLFSEAETGRNRFKLRYDYAKLMRRLIGSCLHRPNTIVELISHVSGPGEDDDTRLSDRLVNEFDGRLRRAPIFLGPSEAKSYISGLTVLVAGRMHACIAAYSSSVPVVPIAYSRKFEGVFDMLDYPWRVPVNGMSEDEALAYIVGCIDNSDKLAASIRGAAPKVDRLMISYRDLLSDVVLSLQLKRSDAGVVCHSDHVTTGVHTASQASSND